MKAEKRENIIFIVFILIVLVMAVVYFSVPERALFLENQVKWWKEFWE
jgi:cell division protein FtsL